MNKGIEIFSLKNKTALITGGSGYLGKEMVKVLAEAGAHVLVNGRHLDKTNAFVTELQKEGLAVDNAVFDITDSNAIKLFFSQSINCLDILINNAYAGGAGTITCNDKKAYIDSYNISLAATHELLLNALPSLRRAVEENQGASIINIASMYGMVSPDLSIYDTPQGANPPFYGAAKAALVQWTRYAACEFGKENIRVNSISPGPFPSLSVQQSNPEFINRLNHKVPMGRIGSADEIRGAVLFLASDAASYVNGANLVVDGGWTCW